MFEPLPAKFDFPAAEKAVLAFWDKHGVFEASLRQREGAPRFVFYEGPPTANGLPHPGHCLTRAIKDLFPRYRTMRGFLCERKAGWDTHGLPVEVEVCKELTKELGRSIHTKQEIEAFGVEKFVHRCITSVWRYTREWEELTRRLGFWVNLEEAYATYHQSYVESVWWSLKTLFERGLLYQGHKVVWWWAQGGTALSAGEVGEGYRAVDDPSVFVKFPLVDAPGTGVQSSALHANVQAPRTSLLVWTTTPWTLISNHFAAVHPELEYALVHDPVGDELLYVAAALVETIAKKVKRELKVLRTIPGERLVGLRYNPPYPECFADVLAEGLAGIRFNNPTRWWEVTSPRANETTIEHRTTGNIVHKKWKLNTDDEPVGWRVLPAGFVTLEAGSGVVHQAPAFGTEDFDLWRELSNQLFLGLPLFCAVDPDGHFGAIAPVQYRGRWVKECDKDIIRELKERRTPWGTPLLYHQETYRHDYPFCPRAENDPLIQYARRSWFVRTSQFKDEFIKNNAAVNWLPEHIKEGRFGDFLRNNVDWALSRERYWGTPLPIWACEKCGKMEAIGSFDELRGKSGASDGGYWDRKVAEHLAAGDAEMPSHLRVHKPYIDEWRFDSPCCAGARMRRVPEVIDCWWDAGSMPFAQWGFPHAAGSIERFDERFPADFISEALDQTRGWFYGLLAISTLLFSGEGSAGILPARGLPAQRPSAPLADGSHAAAKHTGVLDSPVTAQLSIRKRWKPPHWESGGSTYFLTFRMAAGVLEPAERTLVLAACRHWDQQRMALHAAVVMPDHVHLLVTPFEREAGTWWSIADLMHSIKSHTARELNRTRGTSGTLWQPEYFDRIIRNEPDFLEKLNYIIENPVRRGLGEDYAWVWVEPHDDQASDPQESARADSCGQNARTPPVATRRDYPLPYRTCICLGLILGEDGTKMSKRLKNYREPTYIFDAYGADAMRWFFFSAQAPWTSVRFQEAAFRDAQREFLVKLYNVLSFFSIYANIDGFGANAEVGTLNAESRAPSTEGAGVGRSPLQRSAFSIQRFTGWRAPMERSELDRWILSELHRTIRFVRDAMDRFENYPAANRLNDFVDALSNWYVRRSRERFWRPVEGKGAEGSRGQGAKGSGGDGGVRTTEAFVRALVPEYSPSDQDKWDAYNTLYECLLTLSQLIAPFTPFFAETMYQNLRGAEGLRGQGVEGEEPVAAAPTQEPRAPSAPRPLDPSNPQPLDPSTPRPLSPSSVHLCDYPEPDESLINEELSAEMDLVREIASLGRAARAAATVKEAKKVRQPLARVELVLARPEHHEWLESHRPLIAEELNVKAVDFVTAADQYVTYKVVPNFAVIGKKFRGLAQQIKPALEKLPDPAAALRRMSSDGKLTLDVAGQTVDLTPDEVEIRLEARPGWSAAQGRVGVIVLSTELSPELREEGLIRELIHHVQGLRKEANLPYHARIRLSVAGDDALLATVRRHEATIRGECLADRVETVAGGPALAGAAELDIDGHAVRLAIERHA